MKRYWQDEVPGMRQICFPSLMVLVKAEIPKQRVLNKARHEFGHCVSSTGALIPIWSLVSSSGMIKENLDFIHLFIHSFIQGKNVH